jgi:hypothetical protein
LQGKIREGHLSKGAYGEGKPKTVAIQTETEASGVFAKEVAKAFSDVFTKRRKGREG